MKETIGQYWVSTLLGMMGGTSAEDEPSFKEAVVWLEKDRKRTRTKCEDLEERNELLRNDFALMENEKNEADDDISEITQKVGTLEREVKRLKGLLNESIKGPFARRNWKDERFSALQEE